MRTTVQRPVTANATLAETGLEELRARACAHHDDDLGPLATTPCLLVRFDERAPALNAVEEASIARWLRRRPYPVIGIGRAGFGSGALGPACDVLAADPADVAPMVENIGRSPIAAMTLVQVLRVTEHLEIEQSLVVESLAYATLQGGPEFRRWLGQQKRSTRARMPEPGPAVVVERRGDRCDFRLNRPSRRNALSVEMRDALCEALQLVVADSSIREVWLSGRGPCFSSGGDLDEFGTVPDPATGHAVRSLRLPGALLARCAERVGVHVHGACFGAGAELPAFARRVCAARDASFVLPEIRFGLIPGAGGCVSLPRRIGRQRTASMALSGAPVDASQALAWGLVDEIVD